MKNLLSLPALFLALAFSTTAQTDQPARRDGHPLPPLTMAMRNFQTVSISSKTSFVPPDALIGALQRHKEFDTWGISFTTANQADVLLEIDHVPLTFIYEYQMTQRGTGLVLAAGKLHALAAAAPDTLANQLFERIAQYRQTSAVQDNGAVTPKDPALPPPVIAVQVAPCEMTKCPAPR